MVPLLDPSQRTYRLLVVDDDEVLRENLAEVFALEGTDVATAASTVDALRRMDEQAFDLILTDYRMPPGPSGLELVEAANRRDPQLRAIVMTAFGSRWVEIESVRRGAVGYFAKPFETEDLTAFVRGILSR